MRKMSVEFIGTFFLVLSIGLTENAMAIGLTLMVMVYAGGHISGAHYNPAISLAMRLRGRLSSSLLAGYCVAQIFGAVIAAFVCDVLHRGFVPAPGPRVGFTEAVLLEALLTFALAYVILNVSTARNLEGNPFYGAAIGMTVTAGILAVGPLSGGVFNPAVYLGPALMQGSFGDAAIYLIGPITGGLVATLSFRLLSPEDHG